MFMAAGYAAMEGGKTIKQKVERRKKATLDGDFIIAHSDPSKNRRRGLRDSVTEAKQGLSSSTKLMKRSLQRIASSVSSTKGSMELEEAEEADDRVLYSAGQEVELKNLQDQCLNGTKALVLQDFGAKGVLVQFLVKKDGHDNYHESGIMVKPENIRNEEDEKADEMFPEVFPIGALVELEELKAVHMNGLRGTVVKPADDATIKKGRVAVQLLEGSSAAVISVKPCNCRVISIAMDQPQQSPFVPDDSPSSESSWMKDQPQQSPFAADDSPPSVESSWMKDDEKQQAPFSPVDSPGSDPIWLNDDLLS